MCTVQRKGKCGSLSAPTKCRRKMVSAALKKLQVCNAVPPITLSVTATLPLQLLVPEVAFAYNIAFETGLSGISDSQMRLEVVVIQLQYCLCSCLCHEQIVSEHSKGYRFVTHQ